MSNIVTFNDGELELNVSVIAKNATVQKEGNIIMHNNTSKVLKLKIDIKTLLQNL